MRKRTALEFELSPFRAAGIRSAVAAGSVVVVLDTMRDIRKL